MLNSKTHSETDRKQFRVKKCENCHARNIVTVPSSYHPEDIAIPVCPKCGKLPRIIYYEKCPHNPVHALSERILCIKAQVKEKRTKRTKYVFPTNEIPYLWAHKVWPSARNSQRNLYFENGVIYSCGSHFPLAAHVETKSGRKAILLTTRTYSVTTSKHTYMVHCAIPSNVTVFNVPNIPTNAVLEEHIAARHAMNIASYMENLASTINKAQKARRLSSKKWERNEAKRLHSELLGYCKFFRLARPKNIPELPKLTAAMVVKIKSREAFLASPEHRAKLQTKNAKKFAQQIENWRNGTDYLSWRQLRSLPPMLRIKGEEIETSLGERVPLEHARRVLDIVRKLVAEKREFVAKGHTIPIGHYRVDKIDADGTLHAGCHHIPYAEIDRIGAILDTIGAVKIVVSEESI